MEKITEIKDLLEETKADLLILTETRHNTTLTEAWKASPPIPGHECWMSPPTEKEDTHQPTGDYTGVILIFKEEWKGFIHGVPKEEIPEGFNTKKAMMVRIDKGAPFTLIA